MLSGRSAGAQVQGGESSLRGEDTRVLRPSSPVMRVDRPSSSTFVLTPRSSFSSFFLLPTVPPPPSVPSASFRCTSSCSSFLCICSCLSNSSSSFSFSHSFSCLKYSSFYWVHLQNKNPAIFLLSFWSSLFKRGFGCIKEVLTFFKRLESIVLAIA